PRYPTVTDCRGASAICPPVMSVSHGCSSATSTPVSASSDPPSLTSVTATVDDPLPAGPSTRTALRTATRPAFPSAPCAACGDPVDDDAQPARRTARRTAVTRP